MNNRELMHKDRYGIEDLLAIVAKLRAPGGCPWDAEQTHQSIRNNLIEETYEVVEAIDTGDAHLLCEELGDLLLQVVFHVQIEFEEGRFEFEDVCDGICKKLIYRHPHVFKDLEVSGTEEVLKNWEDLKNAEKSRETAAERLDSVPTSLPALMRTAKIQRRAASFGFCYPGIEAALADLDSEVEELKEAIRTGEDIEGELGDVLFSAVNVSRFVDVDSEEALTHSSNTFSDRVKRVERMAAEEGKNLDGLVEETLDRYWKAAKKEQKEIVSQQRGL